MTLGLILYSWDLEVKFNGDFTEVSCFSEVFTELKSQVISHVSGVLRESKVLERQGAILMCACAVH